MTSTQSPERVFRAICTSGVFRIRTRATVGPQNAGFNSASRRVSAHIFNRTVMPLPGSDKVPLGSSQARRGASALNSFLRSLLKLLQQPSRIFTVFGRPSLSFAAAHVEQQTTEGRQACSKNQTMRFTA
jgi:hypothetical protein